MTWPTFAFAGAAIGLWVWGSYWRDRAQRLAHERDLHRRRARRAQTAGTMAVYDGEPPPVPPDPRRGTLWGQPILPSPGETVTDGHTTHRCVPPFLRPGETWTCDTCQMTWGAPVVPKGVPLDEAVDLICEHGHPYDRDL